MAKVFVHFSLRNTPFHGQFEREQEYWMVDVEIKQESKVVKQTFGCISPSASYQIMFLIITEGAILKK